MIGSELIAKLEIYTDDTTELSTVEEMSLINKIYFRVLSSKPWEFLKKEWSAVTTGASYIALPTDFDHFFENTSASENTYSAQDNMWRKVVYVNNQPYRLVNWSDRRQYTGKNGYCYVDIAAMRLYFTDSVAPSAALAITGDYIHTPAAITLTTSPIMPERFQHALYHGAAAEDMMIQLFDKARSYKTENEGLYKSYLSDMSYWNSNLINI